MATAKPARQTPKIAALTISQPLTDKLNRLRMLRCETADTYGVMSITMTGTMTGTTTGGIGSAKRKKQRLGSNPSLCF